MRKNPIRIEGGIMKRHLPLFMGAATIVCLLFASWLLIWGKSSPLYAASRSVDPAKRADAERTCKVRLKYDNKLGKCANKAGDGENSCIEKLDKKLQDCIHLELIRGAESIDEALAIEQEYLGRPLTDEEKLRVTAETMFDEYELRGS
jgi:hypothetical protein